MTEYDYSPEAYERALATQNRIAKWVDTTERHRGEFQVPFGPGGLQQHQRPQLESHSSRSTPTPSRHRNRRSNRHHGGYQSSDSGSSADSHEYGPGPGPMPRGLQPETGYPGPHQHQHQYQQYQPMQMQQQYASPHVQIYGSPAAPGQAQVQVYGGAPTPAIGGGVRPPMLALPPQHQMHASYSYAGAASPPVYPGYPNGYLMAGSPPLVVSPGHSSPRKSGKPKSRRSRSHQPTPTSPLAGAALAAYYTGGYTSPPHTPGYQYAAYPGHSPAATGGGSVTGGYFVPQQYPPMVPMMYRV